MNNRLAMSRQYVYLVHTVHICVRLLGLKYQLSDRRSRKALALQSCERTLLETELTLLSYSSYLRPSSRTRISTE